MSHKQQDPLAHLVAAPPNPERTDVEHHPNIEAILGLSEATLWQDATVLHSSGTGKGITFKGVQEYEAIDCLQHYLAAISLSLEHTWLQQKASSLRVERTEAGVRARFPNDVLDFSNIVDRAAIATKRLSPKDSAILREVTIDLLFHGEIDLPGFDRDLIDGDRFDLILLSDNVARQNDLVRR